MSDRFVVPKRSSNAPLTSGSSSISSGTISSLEIVAAPWRANARSASVLPAPMPPVIATLRGFFRLVSLGLGFCGRLGLWGGLFRLGRRRLRLGRRLLRLGCLRALGEDLLGEAEVRGQPGRV